VLALLLALAGLVWLLAVGTLGMVMRLLRG
jgi:hypothetical protein